MKGHLCTRRTAAPFRAGPLPENVGVVGCARMQPRRLRRPQARLNSSWWRHVMSGEYRVATTIQNSCHVLQPSWHTVAKLPPLSFVSNSLATRPRSSRGTASAGPRRRTPLPRLHPRPAVYELLQNLSLWSLSQLGPVKAVAPFAFDYTVLKRVDGKRHNLWRWKSAHSHAKYLRI